MGHVLSAPNYSAQKTLDPIEKEASVGNTRRTGPTNADETAEIVPPDGLDGVECFGPSVVARVAILLLQ